MSQGKYSPVTTKNTTGFVFNSLGKVPALAIPDAEYNEMTMLGGFDQEGFDSYGYSSFNRNGAYVGVGAGVDRNGYTEEQYATMDADDFLNS